MYEIPFVSKKILEQSSEKGAKRQTARMVELAAVADKLAAAEWPVEWTMTGLAFELPYKIKYGPETERTPAAIRQQLASMGIPDEFRLCSSRSLLELVTAKSEYADRDWYVDKEQSVRYFAHDDFADWDSRDFIVRTVAEMAEMEDRYGHKELIVEDSYQRGTVKGRRQSLDWLFGEEWPELEPEDEFEAEEVEEERAYERQELAIEGLHKVLFGEPEASADEPEQPNPEATVADNPDVTATPMDEDSKNRWVAGIIARHLNTPTPDKSDVQLSAN